MTARLGSLAGGAVMQLAGEHEGHARDTAAPRPRAIAAAARDVTVPAMGVRA